ncbi:hypothetical protein J8273_7054 [Carpediemonas membranifera]|uniref:Uncharacterized protein n=1 Tax=Carpediemonas membranifera TaxID=201153 RepID=A0A8J6AZ46_9EUKA|nr:hypothetical protein J8273_7054 [Carpediemonas membranifera]|eukprot:KAG9390799.1 hypothetical protein J8273_7054 [Carpediemonas membranifera]
MLKQLFLMIAHCTCSLHSLVVSMPIDYTIPDVSSKVESDRYWSLDVYNQFMNLSELNEADRNRFLMMNTSKLSYDYSGLKLNEIGVSVSKRLVLTEQHSICGDACGLGVVSPHAMNVNDFVGIYAGKVCAITPELQIGQHDFELPLGSSEFMVRGDPTKHGIHMVNDNPIVTNVQVRCIKVQVQVDDDTVPLPLLALLCIRNTRPYEFLSMAYAPSYWEGEHRHYPLDVAAFELMIRGSTIFDVDQARRLALEYLE